MPVKPAKKPLTAEERRRARMAPREPDSQPVNVRLPLDLHQALLARAAQEDRSMAATMREACRYYLAHAAQVGRSHGEERDARR